ncbi:Thiol-disulfide isomerase or thioredoxin [Abditibacterium utsteinense]|uniref:Thiol-disulfide isomerase or thioredoxin n=1 Tax=Abditibacterium utsteinense TaxID=1960156 RepID=A0A2S8ST62_9BACT|nr:redoxin family protein [Abditibacterium utsteinense]PQV63987.1 Thiol-disulfide isomerase or thioredoxin [Abditibacterium utsteinense]
MLKKPVCILAMSLLGAFTVVASAPIAAAQTSNNSTETEALALLDKSAAAYAALDGLSMKYTSFSDAGGKISRSNGAIAFEKSGRARIASSSFPPGRMMVTGAATDAEAAKTSLGEAMMRAPMGASVPLSTLVQGKNPLRETTGFNAHVLWNQIRLLPDNGVAATASPKDPRAGSGSDLNFTFYFDPTDQLLRRVDVKAQMKNKTFLDFTTLSDIQINPQFAADTFAAPKVADSPRDPDVYWDPKLKVGTAPYQLTGADLGGKKRDLDQYKGKVVLLDFWATWCGPCVGELPNVLSNYAKYHSKGFEIVAISLDESKKDLTDFVAARKMPWPQLFDGKGWKAENAARYGVKAIPFTLLIGKDGKIAAVNPRGEELEPAIQAALAK